MKNRPIAIETTVFCGIDVSAATLAVAVIEHDQLVHQREFANRPSGHQELIVWLGKRGPKVRVWLEATGNYSLDLDAAPHVELAVLNPKLVNRFAQTLARSKTDAADAVVLAHYSQRMPFTGWQRPRRSGLELRALARHIGSLVVQQTRELNRLHGRLPHGATGGQRRPVAGRDGITGPRSDRAPVGGSQRARSRTSQLGHQRAQAPAHQPSRKSPSAPRPLHAGPGRSALGSAPESLL